MKWISYKDKPIPDGFDSFRGMRFYVIQFKKPDEDPRYPGDYDIELAIAAYYFDGNWMCSEIKMKIRLSITLKLMIFQKHLMKKSRNLGKKFINNEI
jgi:hypothetical protein